MTRLETRTKEFRVYASLRVLKLKGVSESIERKEWAHLSPTCPLGLFGFYTGRTKVYKLKPERW